MSITKGFSPAKLMENHPGNRRLILEIFSAPVREQRYNEELVTRMRETMANRLS